MVVVEKKNHVESNFSIQKNMMRFSLRKNIILKKISNRKPKIIYSLSNFILAKWQFFILWFFSLGLSKFYLLFILKFYLTGKFTTNNSFYYNKLLNFVFKICNIRKILSPILLNSFFHFFYKYNIVQHFFLPKEFIFNSRFLVKKKQFHKIFLNLFKIHFMKFYTEINMFFLLPIQIFYNSNNHAHILWMINWPFMTLINFFEKNFEKSIEFQNFFQKTSTHFSTFLACSFNLKKNYLIWTYIPYQTFLQTNLYLIWNTLLLQNLSANALNVLLLRNFNKIFFWFGDLNGLQRLSQSFFWSRHSIFFNRGAPFYTFSFGLSKNRFLLPNFCENNIHISQIIKFNLTSSFLTFYEIESYFFFGWFYIPFSYSFVSNLETNKFFATYFKGVV